MDIETNGLNATKIHVVSLGYKSGDEEWIIESTNDYNKISDIISNPDNTIIGHNFILFDAVQLENVIGVEVKAELIDTLPLSWALMPSRAFYSLDSFGDKPKIDDWEGLTYKEYKERCEADVSINIDLWEDLSKILLELYNNDIGQIRKYIRYLMFKMQCVKEQERIGTVVDLEKVKENIEILEDIRAPKEEALLKAMPRTRVLKSKPKKMTKKDGSPTSLALKWYDFLRENGHSIDTEVVYEEPNINSSHQKKEWLFSLGWEPVLFNDGANGKVPQIMDKDKNICDSVLALKVKEPAIEHLDGLSIIGHRLGVLKSLLENTDEQTSKTVARMSGFTNTLRLRHSKPIANLPGVDGSIKEAMDNGASKAEAVEANLRDGQIIRECIVAPEGYELCGSDIVSLEENTKRHYMWDYDPEYVEEQSAPDYDAHLNLCVLGGLITENELKLYQWMKNGEQ